MDSLIENSKAFAILMHNQTNHKYLVREVKEDYSYHLQQVYNIAEKWCHIFNVSEQIWVLSACWLHDVIEDCRVNYNDLVKYLGGGEESIIISDIVYNVTDELGKNRKERAAKTYPKIASSPYSIFVKCADRYANTLHSKMEYEFSNNNSMYKKYRDKYTNFKNSFYNKTGNYDFSEIWKTLDEI